MSHRKTVLRRYSLVTNQALGANFQSNPTSLEYMDRAALMINFTGAPVGSIAVEVSVDYDGQNPNAPSTWYALPLALNPLVGVAFDYVIDIAQTAMPWIRLNYTFTGGAGFMSAVITGKES